MKTKHYEEEKEWTQRSEHAPQAELDGRQEWNGRIGSFAILMQLKV